MAIDTKPNLSNNKFEQCSGDIMNLSGCTQIFGNFDIETDATLTICNGAGVGKILTSDDTGIATWQTAASSGIAMSGNTVNGLTTYVDGETICAQSGVTYDGSTLSVEGRMIPNIGTNNIGIGITTLNDLSTGVDNVAIGRNALESNTSGCYNTAIGPSLRNNISGCHNVGLGFAALTNNTTGSYNMALGYYSMQDNTVGCWNVALGPSALRENTSGSTNIAIGSSAIYHNKTGGDNIVLGNKAMFLNEFTSNNIALGLNAMYCQVSGDYNIAIGRVSMSNKCGTYNVALGYCSMGRAVSGNTNIAIGLASLQCNCGGNNNIALGGAMTANKTGNRNIAMGPIVLQTTSGCSNIAIGSTIMQYGAPYGGCHNVVFGSRAMQNGANTCYNFAVGYCSLHSNSSGNSNISFGFNTMRSNQSGSHNIAMGDNSMYSSMSGHSNIALGYGALRSNNCSSFNIALGYNAGYGHCIGDDNIFLGYYAGAPHKCGENNLFLGAQSGALNITGSSNVFIGYCAGRGETGDNKLYIANCGICSLIYGEFDNKTVLIDNKLITNSLQVTGGIPTDGYVLTSDASGNATWQSGGTEGRIAMSGDTVNGLTTYVDSETICSQSGVTYDGSSLSVVGAVNTNTGYEIGGTESLTRKGNFNDNLVIGDTDSSLCSVTSGRHNYVIGCNNLSGLTSACDYIVVGENNLNKASTSTNNGNIIAIGCDNLGEFTQSLNTVVIGSKNACLATGYGNVVQTIIIGTCNFITAPGGSNTTIIGSNSLQNLTEDADNIVAIGPSVGQCGCRHVDNILIGRSVNQYFTGYTFDNVIIGDRAVQGVNGSSQSSLNWNTFIGALSNFCRQGGSSNVGVGAYVMEKSCNNNYNVAIGYGSQRYSYGGDGNVAVGYVSLQSNNTGINNTALGSCTMQVANDTGSANVAVGYGSLRDNITGCYNIAAGYNAMVQNESGCFNIALGFNTMLDGKGQSYNIALGASSLRFLKDNNANGGNVMVGHAAGGFTGGTNNVGIGYAVLGSVNNGNVSANVAIGHYSQYCTISGNCNTSLGYGSLRCNYGGKGNVAIGYLTSCSNRLGSNNVTIGLSAGQNNITGCSNVFIGSFAGYNETGDNKLYIANCGICSLIYGEFDNKTVLIDNKLITNSLQVTGGTPTDGYVLTSDGSGNATWAEGGGGGGGISMSGSTVNGLTTYVDATTICSQSNLTFDGTNLNVTGNADITGLITSTTPATACDDTTVATTAWVNLQNYGTSNLALGTTSITAYRGDCGNAAYVHSTNNSQAHSDYLINNGNDTTSGTLTAAAFVAGIDSNSTFGSTNSNEARLELNVSNAGSPQIGFTDNGDVSWAIGADDGDNSFKIHGVATAVIPIINNLTSPFFEITTAGETRLDCVTVTDGGITTTDGTNSGTMIYNTASKTLDFIFA